MRGVLSREQAREYDRHATEQGRVPSLLLMENAGRGATDRLLELRRQRPGRVIVVAGPGNNGGDGCVVARRLRVLGHSSEVWLVGDAGRLTGDAKTMWDAYVGLGGSVRFVSDATGLAELRARIIEADTVVDALFGTGLARPIEGLYAAVIEQMNATAAFVYALDIPSGLDANCGQILGVAVHAQATATFGSPKLGHFSSDGADCCGELNVVDIGVPEDIWVTTGHSAERFDVADLAPLLRPRRISSHKGRAGRVAIIAGHSGTIGAALLSAKGALRMGAGLVTHVGLPETVDALESRVLETMTRRLDPSALEASLDLALQNMDVVVIGPGLGTGELERHIVHRVVDAMAIPVVVDADALTILSEDPDRVRRAKGPRILLPHRGELGRLLKSSVVEVERDPYSALRRIVEHTQACVALKGAYTFVGAPKQKHAIVANPCPAMGTAGSGDVLSGAIGALSVDHTPFVAVLLGAYLHGQAGRLWVAARGVDRGMVASDIAEHLPAAIAELARCHRRVTD